MRFVIPIAGILLMLAAAYFRLWRVVRSRLIESICGILLMWATIRSDLWPLAPVAAVVTTYGLIRRRGVYQALPFILLLIVSLSFFLSGSTGLSYFLTGSEGLPRFDPLRGALGAAASLGTLVVTAWVCAELLIVHRGGDRRAARGMILSLLVAPVFPTEKPYRRFLMQYAGSLRALQIIRDGRVVHSTPASEDFQMPGPGILIIRSGNAAILERSGNITRIVGPGFHLTETWEHLSAIVDLSLQTETWKLEGVSTRDLILLEVEFTVQYRIVVDQLALIKRAEYRINRDVIRRAALTTAGWKQQMETTAKDIVRATIATCSLGEIYDPVSPRFSSGTASRERLQHELRRRLSRESQRWGVETVRVSLDKIIPPRAISEARTRLEATSIDYFTKRIEGQVKAMAEADRFQQVLISLQRDSGVDKDTLCTVIVKLAGALTDVTDLQALVRLLTRGPASPLDAGPTRHTTDGEQVPPDRG